jgi:hypothetical protein
MGIEHKLAQFVQWAIGESAEYDLEGSDVQEKAMALGILNEVPYDPELHGPSEFEVNPGEPWFVINEEVKALLKEESDE